MVSDLGLHSLLKHFCPIAYGILDTAGYRIPPGNSEVPDQTVFMRKLIRPSFIFGFQSSY